MPDTPSNLESLDKAISDFLESLQPLLQVVAFASIPGSAEAFRQAFEDWALYFQEQDKYLLAFAIKHGLIGVERHFTDEQLWLLVRWTVEHGDEVVNRRLPEFLTLKQIQEIVSGWEHIPYLQSRKKVCDEVVEAFLNIGSAGSGRQEETDIDVLAEISVGLRLHLQVNGQISDCSLFQRYGWRECGGLRNFSTQSRFHRSPIIRINPGVTLRS